MKEVKLTYSIADLEFRETVGCGLIQTIILSTIFTVTIHLFLNFLS